jgi:hypothetical protein
MGAPEFVAALRRRVLDEPGADVQAAARQVIALGAGHVAALIFFGSRRTQAQPDPWSAYDFFVVTRRDAPFYRALRAAGKLRRRPWLLTLLGRVLAPSQISLRVSDERGAPLHVKASVLPLETFRRETSPGRRDHFCVARLFQPTTLAYAADDGVRDEVLLALGAAHRCTFDWARPWLPPAFDASRYARTLLEVSLRSEIRPETADRARSLHEAQRDYLDEVYAALLAELCDAGRLRRLDPERFRVTEPVTPGERRRVRRYFARSLVRTTARWGKHMLTFEGWRDYIVRKIERRVGELRPRERRHPLVFLWPRLYRHVRGRYRLPR